MGNKVGESKENEKFSGISFKFLENEASTKFWKVHPIFPFLFELDIL